MKTILAGFFFFLTIQAEAATMSAPEFISDFVQKTNDRLEATNAERALDGDRPYCPQLNDEQVNSIASLFVMNPDAKPHQLIYRHLNQITAGQFIAAVSENLDCYPTSWLSGKSSIGSFFFNSKAYVMDNILVRKSLEDLAGRPFNDTENLEDLTSH